VAARPPLRRTLRPEELALWSAVAATVRPAPGKVAPKPPEAAAGPAPSAPPAPAPPGPKPTVPKHAAPRAPEHIEPGRKRRLVRERDPIEARLDLHGLDYDRARAALHGFIRRSVEQGLRAVLVITGKGVEGDGVLRRFAPYWLAEPAVAPLIAGVAWAHRRHGGEGALYVTLKRRA
jgi:DNA-nicking Smr family endonuclease